MARIVYAFRVAYQSEDELHESPSDPSELVLTTLPDGQPSYKTLISSGETENEALIKVEAYVKQTPYRDIEDGKLV